MPKLTGFKEDRVGVYIEKDPDAVLDYTLDWSNWLAADDEINSISVSVESISGDSAPLTVDSTTNTASLTTAYISAGTVGSNILHFSLNILH